jgi:hypothetical protein
MKGAQGPIASQHDQGSEEKEAVHSPNGASHEAEERRKQRQTAVHWPKQVVEEKSIESLPTIYGHILTNMAIYAIMRL